MEDTKIIDTEINLSSLRRDLELENIASLQNELLISNDENETEETDFEMNNDEVVLEEDVVMEEENVVEVEIESEVQKRQELESKVETASSELIEEENIELTADDAVNTEVDSMNVTAEDNTEEEAAVTQTVVITSAATTPITEIAVSEAVKDAIVLKASNVVSATPSVQHSSVVTTTLKAIAPKPIITTQRATSGATKANIINAGGQQIVLIQSPGGTANAVSLNTGQPLKIISQTGANNQSVQLPQFQTRQQLVKTTDGNLILRTALPKNLTGSNTLKTNANIKRIIQSSATSSGTIGGQKKMIVATNAASAQAIKTEPGTQVVKIITSAGSNNVTSANKTISLAQAHEMGLLTTTQVQQLLPASLSTGTGTSKFIINKTASNVKQTSVASGNTAQFVKLTTATTNQFQKSPTKILPAPKFVQKPGGQQKVLIKQGNQLKTGIINTGQQVLRIPANQLGTGGQIHQINLPGQGVQYVRLMSTTNSSNSQVATSIITTSSTSTLATTGRTAGVVSTGNVASGQQQQKVQTIVPVALVDRTGATITPGQSIVKVVPIGSNQTVNATSVRPVAPKTSSATSALSGQRAIVATSGTAQGKIAAVPATSLQGTTILPTTAGSSIVMLPTQYVQLQDTTVGGATITVSSPQTPVTPNRSNTSSSSLKSNIKSETPIKISDTILKEIAAARALHDREMSISRSSGESSYHHTPTSGRLGSSSNNLSASTSLSGLEPNGLRPRKPCNCTKSQCLKLYCDCFANGEFCNMCNCVNCYNNLENEEERQKAIRSCLERNPSAFRPKIGKGRDVGENAVRKHTKGCNCKRSGCLKNYCECYEAKIACSSNCKCVGCRNIEDSLEKKSLRPIAPLLSIGGHESSIHHNTSISHHYSSSGSTGLSSTSRQYHSLPSSQKLSSSSLSHHQKIGRHSGFNTPNVAINFRPMLGTNTKQAFAFMTSEVIEATVQCLLASAEMSEKKGLSFSEMENTVIQEFGRCLVEIINTARS